MNTRSELRWLLLSCALTTTGLARAQGAPPAPSPAEGRPTEGRKASLGQSAPAKSTPAPAPEADSTAGDAAATVAPATPPAPADAPVSDASPSASAPPAAADAHTTAAVAHALEEGAIDLDIDALVLPEGDMDGAIERRAASAPSLKWLVGYRITRLGEQARLEISAVPPDSRVRRVAVEVFDAARLELRAMVLLREVVHVARPRTAGTQAAVVEKPKERSAGRAILALNGALLGGYIGVSLQQASDSEDDRLLYPLAALGVGLGLGASMLIADEWDITTEDAWFISAGLIWPTASGSLIAASYDVAPNDRYLYGLSGAAVGLTLAGVTVAKGGVHSGSATIAHSGGAFGQGLGALTEGIVEGNLEDAPLRGMGYGTGIGVLTAGVLATQVEASSSRVLLVDLAALLGGLTGGALATPLLLADDVDDTRRRMWFGSIAAGTLIGGALGVLATADEQGEGTAETYRVLPYGGVIAESRVGERSAPAYGGGVQGIF